MRAGERDLLLLMLAVSAGSADGWSYLGIGHAFVANRTGNTVLLGVEIFGHGGDLLHPAIAIGCYAAGVIGAALLTRNVREGDSWPRNPEFVAIFRTRAARGASVPPEALAIRAAENSD